MLYKKQIFPLRNGIRINLMTKNKKDSKIEYGRQETKTIFRTDNEVIFFFMKYLSRGRIKF